MRHKLVDHLCPVCLKDVYRSDQQCCSIDCRSEWGRLSSDAREKRLTQIYEVYGDVREQAKSQVSAKYTRLEDMMANARAQAKAPAPGKLSALKSLGLDFTHGMEDEGSAEDEEPKS